jgi:hypothetical protein
MRREFCERKLLTLEGARGRLPSSDPSYQAWQDQIDAELGNLEWLDEQLGYELEVKAEFKEQVEAERYRA